MKKIFLQSIFGFIFICSFLLVKANNTKKDAPYATFDKLWVDYDVYEEGVKGMKIHVKFTAYEMYNMDAYLAIYFKYDDESGYLKDKNNKYNSSAGEVAVYKSIKPQYNPAVYDDLNVFMPYNELDLDAGKYDLAMDVKLIYQAGGLISKLTNYAFEYTKPTSSTTAGGAPANNNITTTFKDLWVDFDVYDNGLKGMRIHTKFSVSGMKNIDGYLACYFEKKNGDKLTSNTSGYKSKSGQLAIYKTITPGYDQTDFNDLSVFIPYSEINVPSGRNDLKIDADVIYKDGGLIQHLKYYDFWINK